MCTKPLKGFKYGVTENGKDNYIIASYDTKFIGIDQKGDLIKSKVELPFSHNTFKKVIHEYTEIPCGKCLQCKLRYAKLWADRCMLEASLHKENCFLTLTYDDLNIPVTEKNKTYNPITGEVQQFMTLRKKDLQDFIKRLRYELGDVKIRYFACGEYASRPHYHLIIFGWCPKFDSAEQVEDVGSSNGKRIYSSRLIQKIWSKGHNVIAPCTWETCNYVARYVVKKYPTTSNECSETGIEKEFITMSRRPGIALEWFNSNNVCYATFLNQYLKTENGSIKISPNRYFDSKLDPEILEKIKEVRKHFSEEQKKLKLLGSDLSYLDQLDVEANALMKKTKILKGQIL